jgi:short-subunit dehydrogenase
MEFAERYGPWGVVLGSSAGLGERFAAGIAARGVNVVVVARPTELSDLERVAEHLSATHGVRTRVVTLDLADPGFIEELRSGTEDIEVGLAVYNATGVYVGEFEDQSVESMQSMVAINCLGPLAMCEYFGRAMIARGRGGLVMMSSAAALAGSAYNASYAASKAFGLVLGESLWAEWRGLGVDVMSVIGTAMDTPTFRANTPPEVLARTPPPISLEQVVEEVFDAIGSSPSFVPGESNRQGIAALGALPRIQQVEAMAAAHAGFAKRPTSRE